MRLKPLMMVIAAATLAGCKPAPTAPSSRAVAAPAPAVAVKPAVKELVGKLIGVEDGGYPFYSITIEAPGAEAFSLSANVEESASAIASSSLRWSLWYIIAFIK